MTNWLVNGMPERLPKLKTIWIKSGFAAPTVPAATAGERVHDAHVGGATAQGRPSEYLREMYFSSQSMEMVNNRTALEVSFEMINASTRLLYSSDYPPWDMDLPSTIYDLPFLSEQEKRNIRGGNARAPALYR